MNIIVCLDDRNGMMFNHRRQSKDSILRQRVLAMVQAADSRLLMNSYSRKQFEEAGEGEIETAEDFLSKASRGDFCFVETDTISAYESEIEKLIIYKWNRKYPGDFYLDLDLTGWTLTETEEFAGSSHEKITEEIYIKAGQ